MKGACIILFCMVALAYAAFDEVEEQYIQVRATKKLPGGYTFITTAMGNGKYKCECMRGGRKVWAGMCGVKDKSFSYSDCV